MIAFEDNFRESPMSIKWRVDFLPGEVFRFLKRQGWQPGCRRDCGGVE